MTWAGMSRQYTMVKLAMFLPLIPPILARIGLFFHSLAASARLVRHKRRQLTITCPPMQKGQAQTLSRRFGLDQQFRVVDLGQIDQPSIIAKIGIAQFRVAVQAQSLPDQAVEMPRQIIRQEKRSRFLVRQFGKIRAAGKKFITMWPGNPLHTLVFEDPIQVTAGAAIAV